MPKSYYAVRLSENLSETPEGYLIFRNAVIARTGKQTYKGYELPQRTSETGKDEITMQDLGIGPQDDIDLYREPSEVFSAHTIASFNDKPITDEHPADMLDLDSIKEHQCGHITDVRPGKEPLPSGDLPLLGDGIITDKNLKSKIFSGLRDLSCGYNYAIKHNGNRVFQVDIIGNHVAVVPNGRAGSAAIFDSATGRVIDLPLPIKLWGVNPMANFRDKMVALGFQSFAKDAKPEEIQSGLAELNTPVIPPVVESVIPPVVVAPKISGKDGHPEGCKCKYCMPETKDATPAVDAAQAAKDAKRKSYHDALDMHLDAKDAEAAAPKPKPDVKDETETPMDTPETVDAEVEPQEKDPNAEEQGEKEDGEANDEELSAAAPIIEPINRSENPVPRAVDSAKALDMARLQGSAAILSKLRPVIAASKDKAVQKAFDGIAKEYGTKRASLVKSGGYQAVLAGASVTDSKKTGVEPTVDDLAATANEAYRKQREKLSTMPSRIAI